MVFGGADDDGGDSEPTPYDDDCFGCKVTGTVTFAGVSGYLWYQRTLVAAAKRGDRRFLAACSAVFACAAVWRAVGMPGIDELR